MSDYGWQITLVTMSLAGLVLSFVCDLRVRQHGRMYSKVGLSMATVAALTLAVLALKPLHVSRNEESADLRIQQVMKLAALREEQRITEER